MSSASWYLTFFLSVPFSIPLENNSYTYQWILVQFICLLPQRFIQAFVSMIKKVFLRIYYLCTDKDLLRDRLDSLASLKSIVVNVALSSPVTVLLVCQGNLKHCSSCPAEWQKWQKCSSPKLPLCFQILRDEIEMRSANMPSFSIVTKLTKVPHLKLSKVHKSTLITHC